MLTPVPLSHDDQLLTMSENILQYMTQILVFGKYLSFHNLFKVSVAL